MTANYTVGSRISHYDNCLDNLIPFNLFSLASERGTGSFGYFYGNIYHIDHQNIYIRYDDNIQKQFKKSQIDSNFKVYTGFLSGWNCFKH